jgi:hypothetical protein
MTTKLKSVLFMLFVLALSASATEASQSASTINVTLSQKKARRGEKVEITIQILDGNRPSSEAVRAVLLRPTVGAEELTLRASAEQPGVYRAEVIPGNDSPEGFYVVHAWAGEKNRPSAVGKASFLLGRLINDFFIVSFVNQERPVEDVDAYMRDFRLLGGNCLIAHNIINTTKAFYPSKISKTDVQPGSTGDIVELTLDRADREGYAVLLSVSWDMTRQSPYKDRMKEIKAITSELYELYKHHPSLAGFYSWQEGSGTYYASFVREFSQYVKSLEPNLLTACAPHIDDPLLAGYLSTIEELDILIYQAGVMASYRPDNRKLYPPRRVRDFCSLGAGAKRLQDKIAIPHVEMFAYLEKKQAPDILAASYEDIYRQILSAATVTDADGISLFSYHAHIHLPMKQYRQVEKSREAVRDGLTAYRLITSEASHERNPVAVYFPYSDWIIERWPSYFLPALDAFRALGIPVDILPYSPPFEESVYPYYPINMNVDALKRLLRERTVLVLPNVSGFQQTDSDLIKAFVEQGGVVVAFGPQIPMGRSYERKELFGGDETQVKPTHTAVVVKEAVGVRAKAGDRFALNGIRLPSWKSNSARVIATFEDGSPAITMNQYGKGRIIAILPDAWTASQSLPELVRDVIEHAMSFAGSAPPVDIVGTNENTDIAVERTPGGFRVAVINHGASEMEVMLRPIKPSAGRVFEWIDLVTRNKTETSTTGRSLKLKVPGMGFRALEFRGTSVD